LKESRKRAGYPLQVRNRSQILASCNFAPALIEVPSHRFKVGGLGLAAGSSRDRIDGPGQPRTVKSQKRSAYLVGFEIESCFRHLVAKLLA
jgi:hypothetical protein